MPRRCRYVDDDSHQAYLAKLRREAGRLVRRHWPAVLEIADLLLKKGTIGPDDLEPVRQRLAKAKEEAAPAA